MLPSQPGSVMALSPLWARLIDDARRSAAAFDDPYPEVAFTRSSCLLSLSASIASSLSRFSPRRLSCSMLSASAAWRLPSISMKALKESPSHGRTENCLSPSDARSSRMSFLPLSSPRWGLLYISSSIVPSLSVTMMLAPMPEKSLTVATMESSLFASVIVKALSNGSCLTAVTFLPTKCALMYCVKRWAPSAFFLIWPVRQTIESGVAISK